MEVLNKNSEQSLTKIKNALYLLRTAINVENLSF